MPSVLLGNGAVVIRGQRRVVWGVAEGKEAKEKIVHAAKSHRDAGGARGEPFYS